MNTYSKYAPNVFLAKCSEKHEKGETIEVTTKRGKENESIVFNLIYEKDGFFYYSIVRADGFNVQKWAQERAERRLEWAASAEQKSTEFYNKSNKDADFLSLGEPIKVGHHSEKRHRKAIDDAWNNMGKSVEMDAKAAEHERVAKYWEERAKTINLSMPESIDFYEHKLELAKEYHTGLKSGKYPREHSFSLPYAKKAVNEAQNNYDLAVKLWGGDNTNMTPEEAIKEISEWANASHAYLCNREGYPRGYKDGISQAKIIVLDILSKIDIEQDKSKQKNNMGVNLYTGKVYQVELSDSILSGSESIEAMYDLFEEFEIAHNADNEFDKDYDLERSELQRFRNEIVGHTPYFQERADYFAKKLKVMNLTEEQFIDVLDELINESDQANKNVLLTWF